MTYYKTFQITDIYVGSDYLGFSLNDSIVFSNGTVSRIDVKKVYPYTSYAKYDQIEIDLDYVRSYTSGYEFDNTSVVRRTTLSLIPGTSSSALTNRTTRLDVSEIRRQVNEVNNNPNRHGYNAENAWRDSSGDYYESIEYTRDHASYNRTRKW